MHARFADARGAEQRVPVIPVVMRVEGRAGRRAENQVPVFPCGPGGEALGVLPSPVRPELADERRWDGQDQLCVSLPGLDALAAGEMPASPGALGAFAGVRGASARARPLHLRAAVPATGAPIGAACPVPVPCAAGRARYPVPARCAGRGVTAAVPVAGAPEP